MRISPTGTCRPPRGFTFVELLLVIFIISLLAALVFPSFSVVGESRLRTEARKAAALLRYLNDSSLSSKEQYSLEFDFAGSTLSWKGPEGKKKEHFTTLSSISLPSKGRVREGSLIFFFSPLGAQEPIEISLQDGEDELGVAFSPLSGRSRIIIHEKK